MCICLISMYELTYCFFFAKQVIAFQWLDILPQSEKEFSILNMHIQYKCLCLQTRLS